MKSDGVEMNMSESLLAALPRGQAEVSQLALDAGKAGVAGLVGGIVGNAGSAASLKQVQSGLRDDRNTAARPLLMKAARAINAGDFEEGRGLALKGLKKDEHNGFGWYLLGMAMEMAGDFANSIRAYEAALRLIPDHAEVANDLGRLAFRMGLRTQAEKLFRHYLASYPDSPEAINNLATAMRDAGRYDEAIETLRPAIVASPTNVTLWNTMGTIAGDMGDLENAVIFFSEATRIDPTMARAKFNLSSIQQLLGEPAKALAMCDEAIAGTNIPSDRAMMGLARFNCLVSLGRLKEGWDQYEIRLDPNFNGVTLFKREGVEWAPGVDIKGKSLLVYAEQGLGDELLFANVLPEVIEALGPDGRLILGVERRLISLFQRSFPAAEVNRNWTYDIGGRNARMIRPETSPNADYFAPIASLMRQYRQDYASFPETVGYLKADPERVDHWRRVLKDAPPGPKVGLLWKSASSKGARHRFFSPLDQWRPILTVPGVSFINLQYGDCEEDLAYIRKTMGVEVWQPPGIDLKNDLDDVAALSCALDLTLGFSNATFNLAAGCGAPTWLIIGVSSWPRLGLKDRYPWYPQTRMFAQEGFRDWDATMGRIGEALREWVGERQAA
jgi:tetratricopeptide (TPR) repeat protein